MTPPSFATQKKLLLPLFAYTMGVALRPAPGPYPRRKSPRANRPNSQKSKKIEKKMEKMISPPHHMGTRGEGEKVQNGLKQKLWPNRILRGPCASRRQHNLRVLGQNAPKMTQNDQKPPKNHQKPTFFGFFGFKPQFIGIWSKVTEVWVGVGDTRADFASLLLTFGARAAAGP